MTVSKYVSGDIPETPSLIVSSNPTVHTSSSPNCTFHSLRLRNTPAVLTLSELLEPSHSPSNNNLSNVLWPLARLVNTEITNIANTFENIFIRYHQKPNCHIFAVCWIRIDLSLSLVPRLLDLQVTNWQHKEHSISKNESLQTSNFYIS